MKAKTSTPTPARRRAAEEAAKRIAARLFKCPHNIGQTVRLFHDGCYCGHYFNEAEATTLIARELLRSAPRAATGRKGAGK